MRSIAAGIIVLFFIISIIPCIDAENIETGKNINKEKKTTDIHEISNILNMPDPTVYVTGTKGENGWFISCVNITFTQEPGVEEIWYKIGDASYQKYNGVIVYCQDGRHTLLWYWIDPHQEQHQGNSVFFKLDKTPPAMTLTKKGGLNNKITFTATAIDEASGIEKVEFYLDDVLQQTLTEAPYKWIWTGTESHTVYAIGYNYAGLSEKSDTFGTPRSLYYNSHFINLVFQKICHIIFWNQ